MLELEVEIDPSLLIPLEPVDKPAGIMLARRTASSTRAGLRALGLNTSVCIVLRGRGIVCLGAVVPLLLAAFIAAILLLVEISGTILVCVPVRRMPV